MTLTLNYVLLISIWGYSIGGFCGVQTKQSPAPSLAIASWEVNARKLISEGKYEQARQFLETQKVDAKEAPMRSFLLGRSYGKLRRFKDAEAMNNQALALRPELLDALYNNVCYLALAGDQKKSLQYLHQLTGKIIASPQLRKRYFDMLSAEPDVSSLRSTPDFVSTLRQLNNANKPVANFAKPESKVKANDAVSSHDDAYILDPQWEGAKENASTLTDDALIAKMVETHHKDSNESSALAQEVANRYAKNSSQTLEKAILSELDVQNPNIQLLFSLGHQTSGVRRLDQRFADILLKSKSKTARRSALSCIGPKTIDAFAEILTSDPDIELRRQAALILSSDCNGQNSPKLQKALETFARTEKDPSIYREILQRFNLNEVISPGGLAFLLSVAKDTSLDIPRRVFVIKLLTFNATSEVMDGNTSKILDEVLAILEHTTEDAIGSRCVETINSLISDGAMSGGMESIKKRRDDICRKKSKVIQESGCFQKEP